ncbi:MAG TPA: hypothetical protein VFJ06_11820 [Halococcus sp.]|nr:hypothetical protein [Halococcus sp.]
MSLRKHLPTDWVRICARYAYEETRKNGLRGAREGAVRPWRDFLKKVHRRRVQWAGNPGDSIYDREWDVLVILDACRVDLMNEVADEYPFIGPVSTFDSLASMSEDWMDRNFTPANADETARTAYVTGNPFSRVLDSAAFASFDEVWRYGWDDDLHTIPARPITDRAIDTWRQRDDHGAEWMIVHYMQPHGPFVNDPIYGSFGDTEDFGEGFGGEFWRQAGYTIPRERVWGAYRENLRYVLDDVSVLLENLDAERVVLSADHGNALGEFGIWGHPFDVLIPPIRTVPWVETAGVDEHTHIPTTERVEESEDEEGVKERLRDLGYV